MSWEVFAWEGIKLAVQALTALVAPPPCGALGIESLQAGEGLGAPTFRPSRYSRCPDRNAAALRRWIDEIEEPRAISEDVDREHRDRFRGAARKLEEAMPLAQLLLPTGASTILVKLGRDREGVYSGDQ